MNKQKLAQHIGGLQSASKSQLIILAQQSGTVTPHPAIPTPHAREQSGPSTIFTPPDAYRSSLFATGILTTPLHEPSNTDSMMASVGNLQPQPDNPVGIFEQFIYHLGPPMVWKSLR